MAHWDHLGKNENAAGDDKIYNGAVDNATGTAAIIEIGEAFVQQGAPERSAIFVAVTAEESGLLGSAYYACLLYTSPSPRDRQKSRMPSSA